LGLLGGTGLVALAGTEDDAGSSGFTTLSSQTSSNSNAHAYAGDLTESVSPRTGRLSLSLTAAKLPGIVKAMDLNVTLQYSGDTSAPVLGLPLGWSLDFSSISTDQSGNQYVQLQGRGNYLVDSTWTSKDSDGKTFYPGMRYYNLKDIAFVQEDEAKPLPCATDASLGDEASESTYVFVANKFDGSHEYFGTSGLLLCKDARFGNHLTFYYETPSSEAPSVSTSRLTTIVDSWGQKIELTSTDGDTTDGITLPDGRTVKYGFDSNNLTTVTDPLGQVTTITYDGMSRPSQIDYPTSAVTVIEYNERAFPVK